jgi:tetratricopeptide (TPR) repeat protein
VGKLELHEHLTDAQIEHYGENTAGAGPDQQQQIEDHLAECPSCRTRVLAFHRAQFTPVTTRDTAATGSATHGPAALESMTDTSLTTARRPDDPAPNYPSPDCPKEDDLRDLAAGLTAPDQASQLIQHVAGCAHCGPILRMYTEDFSDDLTPEDQAMLAQLKSSSPEWQRKLVRKLQPVPPRSRFKLPWFRWLLVPATAAAVAAVAVVASITGAVLYSRRETPAKIEKLIAQAYTDKRQLEMRIPYAEHADYHQLRSGESESLLNSPTSLRKAADAITSQLKEHPDDPKWLMLSAQVDLLDWHYKPALSTLDKIGDSNVINSPEFLLARSLALYEKAEVQKDKPSYFEAVDLMGKALQRAPNDAVLLFNRAILCEKVNAYECAETDWNHFLTVEKDSAWSTEARDHLRRIQEKKNLGH